MASKNQSDQASKKETDDAPKKAERHPADPGPATPGVAESDQQPKPPADKPPPPEEKVLEKADAAALFRAGHKLKRKGDPAEKWFQASRIGGVLVLCIPVDEEVESRMLDTDLVLADDAPTA